MDHGFNFLPGGAKRFHDQRRRETARTSTLRGLGEEAYFLSDIEHGSRLNVREGDFTFYVAVGSPPRRADLGLASPTKATKRLTQLARAVLRKYAHSLIEQDHASPTTHS